MEHIIRNNLKLGIRLALLTAVISGCANFLNKLAMGAIGKNAFQYTTLKNIVAAMILSGLVLSPVAWQKLRELQKQDWVGLAAVAVVGGSVPFLLFFKGLSMTSAVSASFIHKTLFIWVAILAVPVLKEKIGKLQALALGLLFLGVMIFDGVSFLQGGYAELLILIATILWAVENVIAKIVLRRVDSLVIAWARMFFGSLILLGFLFFTNNLGGILEMPASGWGWILLVSGFLTGYVISWYAALKRAPATVVTSFLVLAAPVTAMLNAVSVTNKYSGQQVVGGAVILISIIIFSFVIASPSRQLAERAWQSRKISREIFRDPHGRSRRSLPRDDS